MINVSEPLVIGYKAPVHYTSMYGYPKDRLPVYLQSDTEQTSPIGYIKEEIISGKDGAEASRMCYERNGWRGHGPAPVLRQCRGAHCRFRRNARPKGQAQEAARVSSGAERGEGPAQGGDRSERGEARQEDRLKDLDRRRFGSPKSIPFRGDRLWPRRLKQGSLEHAATRLLSPIETAREIAK